VNNRLEQCIGAMLRNLKRVAYVFARKIKAGYAIVTYDESMAFIKIHIDTVQIYYIRIALLYGYDILSIY